MIRRDAGHAPLIIIIVIIAVAILGLLGWLFWHNFINKPQTAADIKTFAQCKEAPGSKLLLTFPEQCLTADGRSFTAASTKTDEVAMKTSCSENEKLCFDYPETWKVEKLTPTSSDEPGYKADLLRFTSPDKKLILMLETDIGGLGGVCQDEDKVDVTILAPTPVPALSGYKDDYNIDVPQVARVAYYNSTAKAYASAIYLTTSTEYASAGTIKDCGTGFSQFVKGKNSILSNDFAGAGAMTFGYDVSNGDDVATYATLDQAKAAFETANYKQAGAILASVHYE